MGYKRVAESQEPYSWSQLFQWVLEDAGYWEGSKLRVHLLTRRRVTTVAFERCMPSHEMRCCCLRFVDLRNRCFGTVGSTFASLT